MKKKIIRLVLLFFSIASYAQQDAQYTQYMYNTIVVNPAYAGSRQTMSIFALHRNQWVGVDGAPVTNSFSINTPFNESKLGLGLSFVNDKIGPSIENNISADFSYTVPVSEKYKMSFGLKASANLLNIDFTKLTYQPGDPNAYQDNIDNKFSPNIGIGFYLHSDNSYIGISAPNLIETEHFDKSATSSSTSHIATEKINYYLIAGYVFDLGANVKFKPSLQTKYVQGSPLQVDISANFMMNEKFVAGLAYRWSAAMSAMVGFQASDSWFIGYSYDFDTTEFAQYNSGSHEIFLRYELFNAYDKIISPRFF
ncbi:PorP/SprF family type IX secretion system membrane protein [Flavobacterium taihuense]|uniref:Type IX secretion system membrane protein PorP/SprF n=1 Tax=Flavobacterium taihuense TaxID=2857508 RepID=A0ABS6XUJ8_9FLAO|nr:type IX secretion system membrane protein PorP/SprF [Flavobacterium taihuense]MBW4359539.1 type IX secretion system membrane protein PorP/SprF [Flavobacterium taihuense]